MDQRNVQPQNTDAEKAVIGAMLVDGSCISDVCNILVASDFYVSLNAKIFEVCKKLFISDKPVDLITVSEAMKTNELFIENGKALYLTQCIDFAQTTAYALQHAAIIKEKSVLRQLFVVSTNLQKKILANAEPVKSIVDFAQKEVSDIALHDTRHGGFAAVADLVVPAVKKIERLHADKTDIPNLKTGFINFDKKVGGLADGDLIIVAGRPGMGKTTFALNIGLNVAETNKDKAVAIFSLEMSKEQLMTKFIANLTQIDSRKIGKGYIKDTEWKKLSNTMYKIGNMNLFIDDCSDLNILDCRTRARNLYNNLKNKNIELKLIIIDYLQLVKGINTKDREREIGEISQNLKALAKDLKLPVIALSQLSRQTEQRGKNKRPVLSDLRDSGSLEQDADMVLFIYREAYYNYTDETIKNDATLIIGKNRNGDTGDCNMIFFKEISKFYEKERLEQ